MNLYPRFFSCFQVSPSFLHKSITSFILLFVISARITNFSGQNTTLVPFAVYWSPDAHELHRAGICENHSIQVAHSISDYTLICMLILHAFTILVLVECSRGIPYLKTFLHFYPGWLLILEFFPQILSAAQMSSFYNFIGWRQIFY